MKGLPEERTILAAEYIIKNGATVRSAAKKFGVSKSTVHKDVSERLRTVMRAASECTMGVYLLHFYVSDRITPWLRQTFPLPGTAGPMLLRAVCVFAVTMALVKLLRKLPFVGRIFL